MGTKEIILITAAVLFLGVAFFAISRIRDLKVSSDYKIFLYYISIVIPVLGLLLVWKAEKKGDVRLR